MASAFHCTLVPSANIRVGERTHFQWNLLRCEIIQQGPILSGTGAVTNTVHLDGEAIQSWEHAQTSLPSVLLLLPIAVARHRFCTHLAVAKQICIVGVKSVS
jgi:hypothetical protein